MFTVCSDAACVRWWEIWCWGFIASQTSHLNCCLWGRGYWAWNPRASRKDFTLGCISPQCVHFCRNGPGFFPQHRPHDSAGGSDHIGGVLQRAGSHRLRQTPRSCLLLTLISPTVHPSALARLTGQENARPPWLCWYRWHRVRTHHQTAHPYKFKPTPTASSSLLFWPLRLQH